MLYRAFLIMLLALHLPAAAAAQPENWEDPWNGIFVFQSKLAKQGNAEAQFKLGEMYEEGRGVEKDLHQAHYWYEKAAAQGSLDAKERIQSLSKRRATPPVPAPTQKSEAAPVTAPQETAEQARKAQLEKEQAAARARAAAKKQAEREQAARERARAEQARRQAAAERAQRQAAAEAERRRALEAAAAQAEPVTPPEASDQAPEEEDPPQAKDTKFRTNPCDGPAARFTSTCR